MRLHLFPALLAVALSCLLLAHQSIPAQAEAGKKPGTRAITFNPDIARVRNHLRHVEMGLRQKTVGHLTPSQRVARAHALDNLHRYWQAGRFPRNEHFPGLRVPYFRDAHGTLCAMAYLIERSGAGALVNRVTRTKNNAYVRELAGDLELQRWLRANGMTAAEASWVQPAYDFDHQGDSQFDVAAWTATSVTTVLSGGALYANLMPVHTRVEARTRGVLGVSAGTLSLVLGASLWNETGQRRTLSLVNTSIGVVTVAFGVRSLLAGERIRREQRAFGEPFLRRWEISSFTAPSGARLQAAYRF